jgi:hypothetical protein
VHGTIYVVRRRAVESSGDCFRGLGRQQVTSRRLGGGLDPPPGGQNKVAGGVDRSGLCSYYGRVIIRKERVYNNNDPLIRIKNASHFFTGARVMGFQRAKGIDGD